MHADLRRAQPPSDSDSLTSVRHRLEFQFALLSGAGGLVLASGQGTEGIALIAVFAAVIGFLFVDWLKLFELPPAGAYLGMGAAAIYCVRDFWDLQERGEPQMVSVALLLVLVQAVLMLQRKSRRILEQLAVFCLLELVVAAIFSDAINFGLLMIPIALVGASALSLLGLVSALESLESTIRHDEGDQDARRRWWSSEESGKSVGQERAIVSASPESIRSLCRAARTWSRFAVLTLAPAVIVIAAAFFYVLPRKVEPERSSRSGPVLVGFNDQVRLEQFGSVTQTPTRALSVELTESVSGEPYRVQGSLYLRGKVLERYEADLTGTRPTAIWSAVERDSLSRRAKLPDKFFSPSVSDRSLYDEVQVKVTCESMRNPSLFSIAPYHAAGNAPDVVHAVDRWTLAREYPDPPFPRVKYRFGTHAFSQGVQTPWIARARQAERVLLGRFSELGRLMKYDRRAIPTAAEMAERIVAATATKRRSVYEVAKRMEAFLSQDPQFSYTLDLNADPIPGMDPIEQFLSQDRKGHCQYFASALAMMLRSVGIPCRVVVGFRTEEFNRISESYVVRQSHAHSWVEALIDADHIPEGTVIAGQPKSRQYWLRLDPTPGASVIGEPEDSVDQLLGLANNFWEDYVIEMDADRQNSGLAESSGLTEVQSSYQVFFQRMSNAAANIRAGRLGGGSLSGRNGQPLAWLFAALAGVFLLVGVARLKWFTFRRRPADDGGSLVAAEPRLAFYAEALSLLQRVGMERHADETPIEFLVRVGRRFPSMGLITETFQRARYGGGDESADDGSTAEALAKLRDDVEASLRPEQ